MLFTEQFPQHRAGEIARAVQRGARFIEAMLLGRSVKVKNEDEDDMEMIYIFRLYILKYYLFNIEMTSTEM